MLNDAILSDIFILISKCPLLIPKKKKKKKTAEFCILTLTPTTLLSLFRSAGW